METIKTVIYAAGILYLLVYIILAFCAKKPLRTLFYSALLGITALLVLNLTKSYTGFCVPINLGSVTVSSAGGVAGVVLLLLLRLIM